MKDKSILALDFEVWRQEIAREAAPGHDRPKRECR
jgi:hypothetical protein